MEETIHINVEIRRTESGTIAITTTRLWPSLLKFTRTLRYEPMKGQIVDGICLTILNNLALIIEGFVTDLLLEEIKRKQFPIPLNPERATWSQKKDVYPKVFGKSLSEYPQYEAIEVLFLLRNNVAHGRSHAEISRKDGTTDEWSYIESENRNYQVVRDFLVEKRLMERKIIPSNVDAFWKPLIAAYFYSETENFLFAVIGDMNEEQSFGILSELRSACSVKFPKLA
jgi:hypothetical protein